MIEILCWASGGLIGLVIGWLAACSWAPAARWRESMREIDIMGRYVTCVQCTAPIPCDRPSYYCADCVARYRKNTREIAQIIGDFARDRDRVTE